MGGRGWGEEMREARRGRGRGGGGGNRGERGDSGEERLRGVKDVGGATLVRPARLSYSSS